MCMITSKKIVYHGSKKNFKEFNKDSMGLGGSDGILQYGHGFYFTDNKDVAQGYGEHIKEATLILDNPLTMDTVPDNLIDWMKDKFPSINNYDDYEFKIKVGTVHRILQFLQNANYNTSDVLKGLGYDGIVDPHPYAGTFVVFEPEQINISNRRDAVITAYCAAPVAIEKMDFDKVGSGTGVLRYAFGMYAGEVDTAQHYLDSYKGYGGASRSFRMGHDGKTHIEADSLGYELAAALVSNNHDYDALREEYKNDDTAIMAIGHIEKAGGIVVDYGAMHKIKIPGVDIDDVKKWDDIMEPEDLDALAMAFYERQPEIASRAEDVLLSLDEDLIFENVEGALDDIWDMAYNNGIEEDLIPFHVDEDEIKKVWNARVRNDSYSMFDFQDEFDEGIDSKYLDAAKKIVGDVLCIQNEMTIGDAYLSITSSYDPDVHDVDMSVIGKKMASELFSSSEIDIPMVVAPTKFGNEKSYELIIMSEDLGNSSRIEKIDPFDVIDEPKDECSLTRLRFSERGIDNDHDSVSYSNAPAW